MRYLINFLFLLGVLLKAPLCFSAVLEKHFYPFWQRATDKTSQQLLLAYIPVEIMAQKTDNQIRDDWKNHRRMHESDSRFGDRYDTYGVGSMIALTQLWLDPQAGESHLRAIIYNGIATHTLKTTVQRQRPSSENQRSFPSGHTSSAFTTATALTYAYGAKAAVVAYPLATFVGLSRMADDVHWFSDVVSGAFVGIWIGRASYFSSSEGNPAVGDKSFFFFPTVAHDNLAMNFHWNF